MPSVEGLSGPGQRQDKVWQTVKVEDCVQIAADTSVRIPGAQAVLATRRLQASADLDGNRVEPVCANRDREGAQLWGSCCAMWQVAATDWCHCMASLRRVRQTASSGLRSCEFAGRQALHIT